MRLRTLTLVAAGLIASGAASAQTSTTTTTPATPAPATRMAPDSTGTTAAPALKEGANSFTESQARNRIEMNGFTGLSDLKKDDKGIWRAKAMKDGKTLNVSLDFKGDVAAN